MATRSMIALYALPWVAATDMIVSAPHSHYDMRDGTLRSPAACPAHASERQPLNFYEAAGNALRTSAGVAHASV